MESLAFTVACTPTTAFNLRSATVVAGSARFTWPAFSCATSALGSASTSTLSPTASAVVGLTPCTTWCIFSVSVQNASSPNVSNRNTCCPSSSVRSMGELVGVVVDSVHAAADATSAARNQRCVIGHLSGRNRYRWILLNVDFVSQASAREEVTSRTNGLDAGLGGEAPLQGLGRERAGLGDERPRVFHLAPGVPQQATPDPPCLQGIHDTLSGRLRPVRYRLEPGVQVAHC